MSENSYLQKELKLTYLSAAAFVSGLRGNGSPSPSLRVLRRPFAFSSIYIMLRRRSNFANCMANGTLLTVDLFS